MSSSLRNAPSTNEHKKTAAGNNYHNRSLSSLLHYFVGVKLQVETKTGRIYSIYSGRLENADAHMNIALDEATLLWPATAEKNWTLKYNPQCAKDNTSRLPPQETASQSNEKKTTVFPSIHIRGQTKRHLHFPDDLDLQGMIRLGMDREWAAAQKCKRGIRKSWRKKKIGNFAVAVKPSDWNCRSHSTHCFAIDKTNANEAMCRQTLSC